MSKRKEMEFNASDSLTALSMAQHTGAVAQFVTWFEMHPFPEELAKRLAIGSPNNEFNKRVMDAYKIFASKRRAAEVSFEYDPPPHPENLLALGKAVERAVRRRAIGDAARTALAEPLPFERPMRDVLLKPVALDEPL